MRPHLIPPSRADPPVDHISTDTLSHHNLVAAAQLLTDAVHRIRDNTVKKEAQRFAERIMELRAQASAAAKRNATIQYLQTVDESAQLEWARTAIVPCARAE